MLRIAVALSVAVVVVFGSALVDGERGAAPARAAAGSCAEATVRAFGFRGVEYTRRPVAAFPAGREVGAIRVLAPACVELVGCRADAGCATAVADPVVRRVAVFRLRGIRPQLAVARADVRDAIFVAAGRCPGTRTDESLFRCLRRAAG